MNTINLMKNEEVIFILLEKSIKTSFTDNSLYDEYILNRMLKGDE